MYVGKKNIEKMKQTLGLTPEVKSLLDWYNSFPDLTAEQLDEAWKQIENMIPALRDLNSNHNIYKRLAYMKGHDRAINWALNYVVEETDEDIASEIIEEVKKRLTSW